MFPRTPRQSVRAATAVGVCGPQRLPGRSGLAEHRAGAPAGAGVCRARGDHAPGAPFHHELACQRLGRSACWRWHGGSGRLRTACTTCAMSPVARTPVRFAAAGPPGHGGPAQRPSGPLAPGGLAQHRGGSSPLRLVSTTSPAFNGSRHHLTFERPCPLEGQHTRSTSGCRRLQSRLSMPAAAQLAHADTAPRLWWNSAYLITCAIRARVYT